VQVAAPIVTGIAPPPSAGPVTVRYGGVASVITIRASRSSTPTRTGPADHPSAAPPIGPMPPSSSLRTRSSASRTSSGTVAIAMPPYTDSSGVGSTRTPMLDTATWPAVLAATSASSTGAS
jgi:hypothetical protein